MTDLEHASSPSKADLTVDFDHHSPDLSTNPYETWTALRSKCPVTWTDAYDGFWVVTGYEEVSQASRDDAAFLSGPPGGTGIPDYGIGYQIPLETDAPMTQKYRKILQSRFTPAAATAAEPTIRAIAQELVDEFIERGSCDLINEYSTPLTARFILRILGFDEHRWAEFTHWVHTLVHSVTSDPDAAAVAIMEFYGAVSELIAARRAAPEDDIVSELVQAEIDGEPLDDDTVANYTMLLVLGGLDTTSASLGNVAVRFDRQPELRQRLLDQPELLGEAIEELLRIDSPVQALARTVAHDTELGGVELREGDRCLLAWAAANRDPSQFPDPDEVDLEREGNRHLTFGVGLHRCLGSNFGRTMLRVMVDTMLARFPDVSPTEDPDQHRYPDAGVVWGHRSLPVRFTPGARLGTPS